MSNLLIDSIDNLNNKESNVLIQNLIQSINCPICQDLITQPILIPNCGHSFCYSCLKHWSQCNPSCPVCRKSIENNKPVINHSLRKLINILFDELKNNDLKEWRIDKDKEYLFDEKNGFPWLTKIENNFGRAIVDNEDGVPRCSSCHWELIDGLCENCGRMMVGWQPRTDGDDLDVEDEEQEEENDEEDEEEEDDDDWEDYDNGIRDINRRGSAHYEDEDENEDEDDEDGTNVYSYDNEDDYLDLHTNEDDNNDKSIRKVWPRSEHKNQFLLHDEDEELIPREKKDNLQSSPINEIMLKNYERTIADDPSMSSYVSDDGFVVDDDDDLEEVEDSEDYSDEISDADALQNIGNGERKDKQIEKRIEEDEFDDDSVILLNNNNRSIGPTNAEFVSLDSDYESDEEIKNFQSRRKKILVSEDEDDIEEVKQIQQASSSNLENENDKDIKRKKDKKKRNKSKNKSKNKKRHKHKHPESV